ncbi:hypothetical protein KDU71_15580 [Carboxylicivirga sediminis]|uniref:SusF/SusE family outer membrane protein n=1 Tax=Carboxylicivirga sediminis TaxID=2006564 RepID=A0A941F6R1_9BACT|nr:hypothetical protein [Carboxylicivirga sediminis]MBR8536993.1 hypothetical protein [Carboxylicivirga sediminis]
MKSLLKIPFTFLMLAAILLLGCEDDDKAGTPPTADNVTDVILAEPGDNITFEGTFNAEDGFSKISLINDEIMLDKQIVFANHVTQYYLDYKFTVPATAALKIYDITITAETLAGETENYTTKVDVATPPSVDVTTDFVALPGEEITFEGTITDAQGLTEIKIVNAGIGLEHVIELADNPTSYELSYTYTIPVVSEMKVHNGTIDVANKANRTTTLPMKVNLSGDDIVYENIYIAGGFQWWTWSPHLAYPMDVDPNDDKWFEVPVHCWDGEFEELKFLGQLDWAPDNWGLVDQADPSKGMLNDESSATILLGANGANPAYKKVRFNPYTMQYSVEDITDVVTPRTEMYIVGNGYPAYPDLDWNPEAAIPMTQNPYGYGEHIFLIEGLEFSDDVSLKFIGQTTGWDYDAGFDVAEQEVSAPVNWVKIKEGSGTKDLKFKNQAGTYTVLYDYYLKRALIWQE